MDMKRTLGVFLSVGLATLGLLTVPVGLVYIAFSPIGGIVMTVICGLVMGLGVVLGRWIDQPQKGHHH